MKKQIEEMAKAICHAPTCEIRKNGGTCYKYCKAYIYAFRAINADYRKASDVAREIFNWLEGHFANLNFVSGNVELNFGDYLEFKVKTLMEYEKEKK